MYQPIVTLANGAFILTLIAPAIAPAQADAQEQALVPDRPGFGDSPAVVLPGFFLLEAGYNFIQDDGQDTHNAPELLLRAGLTPRLELRIGWDGYMWNGEEGALNTRTGFKFDALDQSGVVPELAIIPEMLFPTDDEDVASDEVEGEIRLAGDYVLTEALAFGGNANFAERKGTLSDDHFFEFAGSATLGLAVTDSLGGYVEYFTIMPDDPALEDSESINGGFTYIVDSNIQVDTFAGFGLDENADGFFAGGGFAFVW
jgi:hypothetical protein